MPNFAGAPVYGNGWGQQIMPASASQYAPAEPSYAPAEPLRPNYRAATTPAAPEKTLGKATPAPASTSTYSYQMAPAATLPAYVGQTTDLSNTSYQSNAATSATADPYAVVTGQSGAYQAAPSYAAPATPDYKTATAPAYQPAATPSYQTAPATTYQSATAPAYQTAPSYEAAPVQQSATSYQAAPAYQAATPTYETAPAAYQPQTTYEAAPAYQSQTSYEAAPATTYEAAPSYQSATSYEAAPAYETQSTASSYEMTTEAAPIYQEAPSYGTQGYETVAAPAYSTNDFGTSTSSSFSSGNGHFVQVGAFRNPARAERLVRKLQGAGEQPIITQATVRGKLFHRVRVPAMDKRDASTVRTRIRGLGYYEARTVRG